ncbi:16S rRNA (cytosine(1402)-N(4))-methyltransferase [Candidatus Poribacteria bacterium]|nr:16S rRNA (cytosine(1402)-N(4))-methyltransferase [Candidatus Poribacteria bacterium]MAJ75146.1 16S rRNA (cytosine(1402)-N(4))-methyltransferase [Candidatus Poribacteria bacterium]OUT53844.1 MAG: 16S rRNA (cytosine(1402)-N(4))-methyltransferase [bacterium TMED15]OUT61958.1 MAG: 16S rRNA (cytosine(1402)-N(4))-methyltransferase [bacterium TMED15]
MSLYHHKPVLYNEIIKHLKPTQGGVYLDGTLGAGGHSEAILSYPETNVIGLDLDPIALEISGKRLSVFGSRFQAINGNFADWLAELMPGELHKGGLDGILVDLGVSSMQIDQPKRGFSFQKDGPLDMRMNPNQELSAKEVVNGSSQGEIAEILWKFGEERLSRRIAYRIVQQRRKGAICRTEELANLVLDVYTKSKIRRQKIHPATRTFQALRIFVNGELENLQQLLSIGYKRLKIGGYLCIISFHSLEDRLVKHTFRKLASSCICPTEIPVCRCEQRPEIKILTRRPVMASREEIEVNPRSRSAKLRVALRI